MVHVYMIMEFAAFTLPGAVAVQGYPWTCFALLAVYWAGHTMGATARYKAFKSSRLQTRNARNA